MLEDPRGEAIVRSIIELARNLGLTVVAEGIESEAVMDRLAGLGCETGQGYLISRPLPAEELTEQLTDGRWRVPTVEPHLRAGADAVPVADCDDRRW